MWRSKAVPVPVQAYVLSQLELRVEPTPMCPEAAKDNIESIDAQMASLTRQLANLEKRKAQLEPIAAHEEE